MKGAEAYWPFLAISSTLPRSALAFPGISSPFIGIGPMGIGVRELVVKANGLGVIRNCLGPFLLFGEDAASCKEALFASSELCRINSLQSASDFSRSPFAR